MGCHCHGEPCSRRKQAATRMVTEASPGPVLCKERLGFPATPDYPGRQGSLLQNVKIRLLKNDNVIDGGNEPTAFQSITRHPFTSHLKVSTSTPTEENQLIGFRF